MDRELYRELKRIEDRLYDIANEYYDTHENDNTVSSKLFEAWCALFSFLEEVRPNEL